MPHKDQFDYFDAFHRIGEYAVEEAHMLLDIFRDFDSFDEKELLEKSLKMHEIENASDQVNHEVFTRIANEFITPIDREDIINLTQELDNVVDRIESVIQHVYMLNIKTVPPAALEITSVIVKSAEALCEALSEFSKFKKSKNIRSLIVEVNTLEEKGDGLYMEAMRDLYTSDADALRVIGWTKLFDRLERSCDACEHAANVIETAIMKNS